MDKAGEDKENTVCLFVGELVSVSEWLNKCVRARVRVRMCE